MPATAAAFSHIGLCVSDIDRARRFYIDALGFAQGPEAPIDASMAPLLGMPDDLSGNACFLVQGGLTLELLAFTTPGFIPVQGLRPVNQGGLTHIAFRVEDIDAVAERIESCGGAVVRSSRLDWKIGDMPMGELLFCTDPDGNRIELAKLFSAPGE